MREYDSRLRRRKRLLKIRILVSILLSIILFGGILLAITYKKKPIQLQKPDLQGTTTIIPDTTPAPTDAPSTTVTPTDTPSSSTPPSTERPVESPTPQISASDRALFDDAVFIGDSRTEGLQLATGLSNAKFLTHRGLTVLTAFTDKNIKLSNGQLGTIIDGLKEQQYKKVFIMFGVNELGWPYVNTFEDKYRILIEEIQKLQPNAEIYVQSIIPVTKEKSDGSDIYTNKNVKKFNAAIVSLSKNMNLHYLDVQQAVTTSGILPSDASPDGVHLNKKYCMKWLNYIINELNN